jgi:hypothetical protein
MGEFATGEADDAGIVDEDGVLRGRGKLKAEVFRLHPLELAVTLNDDGLVVSLVTKHCLPNALGNGVVDWHRWRNVTKAPYEWREALEIRILRNECDALFAARRRN